MEIDHPLLFVGIGGTGGRIGAELERRLRQEVRGPDGAKRFGTGDGGHLPYELPSCFQFIYVDIDESDLERLKGQVPRHEPAVARTMRTASKLLPAHRSFAQVAQYLRIKAEEEVHDWLPPADGEPRVAPLSAGAGQLPTVGRACLFARIAEAGIAAAQEPVTEAIERLRKSAVDLAALGGLNPSSCDVFVAFSVVGGTGNGMFYDYIHLISDAFQNTGIAIQVYPLVVMPSAFAEGNGGGRNAMLNAGRGLLDLSRLIDDQNMRDADVAFRPAAAERDKGQSVAYRDGKALKIIQIEPSTLQTTFLFSRTAAITQQELHGSIVSFITSMAGIRSAAGALDGHSTAAQSTFINQGVDRQTPAPSGIGGRGMSTAAVASMSVPRGEILSLFAARLLSEAIERTGRVPSEENNEPLLDAFFNATNLTDLISRPHLDQRGAEHLRNPRHRALAARGELDGHKDKVFQRVHEMAHEFDPGKGLAAVAREPGVDPFRAERAISGSTGLPGASPSVSTFLRQNPTDLQLGELSARPSEQQVKTWLEQNVSATWLTDWAAQSSVWGPRLDQLTGTLRDLTSALRQFRADSDKKFAREVKNLFTDHATMRNFLHNLPREAHEFYRQLASRLATSLGLDAGATDAEGLMAVLLGEQRPWERLILDAADGNIGPYRALSRLHEQISVQVLGQTDTDDQLLPHLADLIIPATGARNGLAGTDAVRNAVRGMVPTGLLMKAVGPAKVLVTYPVRTVGDRIGVAEQTGDGGRPDPPGAPQLSPNREVEDFLKETIDVGSQPGEVHYEFRPTAAEALTVVMVRTALGITDIPEARQVMSLWADALRKAEIQDSLRWRQRLGYDYGWLLTTEEQRVSILQRLLIAMRNGWVEVLSGGDEWPAEVAIRASAASGSGASRLELPLQPWDEASPWGDLLHAYEESILAGDELNRQEMYRRLMAVMPSRQPDGRAPDPAPLYQAFLKVQEEELAKLENLLQTVQLDPDQRLQVAGLRDFWKHTVPAARNKKIPGFAGIRNTLAALDAAWSAAPQP